MSENEADRVIEQKGMIIVAMVTVSAPLPNIPFMLCCQVVKGAIVNHYHFPLMVHFYATWKNDYGSTFFLIKTRSLVFSSPEVIVESIIYRFKIYSRHYARQKKGCPLNLDMKNSYISITFCNVDSTKKLLKFSLILIKLRTFLENLCVLFILSYLKKIVAFSHFSYPVDTLKKWTPIQNSSESNKGKTMLLYIVIKKIIAIFYSISFWFLNIYIS